MEQILDENNKNNAANNEKRKTKKISVRIDDDMDKSIESIAEKNNASKSNVLRIIIEGHLNSFTDHCRYVDEENEREIKSALYFAANMMGEYKSELQKIEFQLRKIGTNYNQQLKYMDEFSDKDSIPVLPRDEINNLIEETKKIAFYCNEEFEIYGEVLRCLLPV